MLLESDFPPDIRVENEISALSKAGHTVFVICTTKNNRPSREQLGANTTVLRSTLPTFIYKSKVGQLKFPLYHLYWKYIIKKHLKEISVEIDVIHAHDLSLASVAVWLKYKFQKMLILDLHENYPYLIKDAKHTQKGLGKWLSDYKYWIKFERKIVTHADYIICVVDEMRKRMLEFDVRPHNYFVYQNVVNSSEILNYVSKSVHKPLKLVYVGGITPTRGIQTVIKAISLLKDKEESIEFNIYGSGSYLNTLKKMVIHLNVQNKVIFHGNIPQEEVFKRIRENDLAIIPHLKSIQNDCSSPNKLFQYLSVGVPVVVSNCLSLERIVTQNNMGIIYKDTDEQSLAKVLKHIISFPEEILEMGKNGHRAVYSKFNTQVEGDKLVDFYKIVQYELAK